jgi:hypothetical protein
VMRVMFYHACAWTGVEIAKVQSHPGDTRGKRVGHMWDTFQGRDTNFFGMQNLVFGTGVGIEKVSPWVVSAPPRVVMVGGYGPPRYSARGGIIL